MNDKGQYQYGHQFKTKARTYKAIANDLRDVMREHESPEVLSDSVTRNLYFNLQQLIKNLEDAYIAEDDKFQDND